MIMLGGFSCILRSASMGLQAQYRRDPYGPIFFVCLHTNFHFRQGRASGKYARLFLMLMMKYFALLVCAVLWPVFAAEIAFDFTKSADLPPGFHSTATGDGKPGVSNDGKRGIWRIVEDEVPNEMSKLRPTEPVPKQRVLAQLSRNITDEHYPILVYTKETFGDFTFKTRI